ncbi:uncharacterized protein LOC118437300 isoform X1 [Folsomia candida]|uniref:uncharacterized protein LOC118436094 isoform X1 n=1 Tax=Folsomia candida TaxID=158441 RepID=UPI001604D4FF|nr:uncharacterized protein LOC118436094 isoform X1 [Folsomia candida]XP_035712129.1 uncharacterized protein LOC118437300 isoform X1 [Folsomia candida]
MGRRRLFQLSARQKRRLVKRRSEIFEENLNSDLVQAEGENIYLEQVFEEDLEEIEVGSNTSEGSSTETISSESEDAVAAHPRTPNFPDEGTVDEEIHKSLKNVADRVGKRSDLTSRPISLPGSSDYSTYVYFNVNSYVYYMIFRINKINYKLD